MKNRYLWTTKSGDTVWVDEMTDGHLINSYKFMLRKSAELEQAGATAWGLSFQGEMAQYYQDQAIDEISEASGEAMYWIGILKEEIERRKLSL